MENTAKQLALLLLLSLFTMVTGSGCRQATKEQTAEIEMQPLSDITLPESNIEEIRPDTINVVDTVKIVIDMSYFEAKTKGKKIKYEDGEYYKYGITSLNTQFMTSESSFLWDDTQISFFIIDEIKLYDNIHSLIIRGDTEHTLGIWLVNYDMNNNIPAGTGTDSYTYIDSYPIGYDEWAESASYRKSIVYILPEPYIEQEYISWEERENYKIEILKSGKFEVTETIRSKHEM